MKVIGRGYAAVCVLCVCFICCCPHGSQAGSIASDSDRGLVRLTNETGDEDLAPEPTPFEPTEKTIYIPAAGVHYIRWGSNDCPETTEVVYRGYTAGSHQSHAWGGSTTLCMHDEPEWGNTVKVGANYIYGAEYAFTNIPFLTTNNGGNALQSHDVPCIACYASRRSTQLMIPGRLQCPDGWTFEYKGYLVSNFHDHARGDYVCLDEAPGVIVGGVVATNGIRFQPVIAGCGSLPCPKYVTDRPITCVVCTK